MTCDHGICPCGRVLMNANEAKHGLCDRCWTEIINDDPGDYPEDEEDT